MTKSKRPPDDDFSAIDSETIEPPGRDLSSDRGTKAYGLGVQAYKDGFYDNANPFKLGFHYNGNADRRRQWFVGHLDQRTRESLKELFEKYGVTEYP